MRSEEEIANAIETYADMVRRLCFIRKLQEADVDDVFQTVFLKYAKSPAFETREHEKAWLIRVTINACKDSLTTWFRRRVGLYEHIADIADVLPQPMEEDSILPLVMKLDTHYRDCIYLFYYEGYKVKEIAQILKCRENTVHTWLRRAREQLKLELGGEHDETAAS